MTFYVNGVDAASGRYLPPLTAEHAARLARGGPRFEPQEIEKLRSWLGLRVRGLAEGDAGKLEQAGWGVIFATGDERTPGRRKALRKLLDWRRAQVAKGNAAFYHELAGEKGYHPGDTKGTFLLRQSMGAGPAVPAKVPYYLLIVGDPATIPFSFQHQLAIEYAVGRLDFATDGEYERYAEDVIAAEEAAVPKQRRLAFFGTSHPGDECSKLSSLHLVKPLADQLEGWEGWETATALGRQATKAQLSSWLGGAARPDLLFSATHGVLFPCDDSRQAARQGALVCQDWPGPAAGAPEEEHLFAADDLADDARVAGMVSFQFACFTGGTPELDAFGEPLAPARRRLAPRPFVARLAQRLLAHPQGGALAVVGHVDRAFPGSIVQPGVGSQIRVFERALCSLLSGEPVGLAMADFGQRYAELSSDLEALREEEADAGKPARDQELGRLWTASHDVRNYTILGDPAVRLPVKPEPPRMTYRNGAALERAFYSR